MNSSQQAVLLAAVLCVAAIVAWVVITERLDRRPEQPRRARRARGRHVFADPADLTDPDGEKYVSQLLAAPGDDFWAQHAPPPRVEILTGPAGPAPDETEIEDTGVQPAYVCDLGIPADTTAYIDGLLAKHAQPEMIP